MCVLKLFRSEAKRLSSFVLWEIVKKKSGAAVPADTSSKWVDQDGREQEKVVAKANEWELIKKKLNCGDKSKVQYLHADCT